MIFPPVGLNVYIMNGLAQVTCRWSETYKGVIPFLLTDFIRLALLIAFPAHHAVAWCTGSPDEPGSHKPLHTASDSCLFPRPRQINAVPGHAPRACPQAALALRPTGDPP